MPKGKPPANAWKKGVSGNPGGNSKDAILSQALRIAIRRVVIYAKDKDGNQRIAAGLPKKHTYADVVINTLMREAVTGNLRAIHEMFNRLEGSPDANLTVIANAAPVDESVSVQETVDWIARIIAREEAAEPPKPRPN